MSAKKIAMAAAGAAAAPTTVIEYVGGYTTTINGTTSNTNVTLTSLTGGLASSPSAGDLVVVYFAVAGAIAGANLAISGYTEVSETQVPDTNDVNLLVAYKMLAAADTSFTITGGTGDVNDSGVVAVQVFRNALPPIQSATADTANTALANPPAITPTTAGSWIIAGGGAGHAAGVETFSSSDLTNFITVGTNQTYDATVGMGYKVWTSGAFDPAAFTFSTTDSTQNASTATTMVIRVNNGVGQQLFTTSGTTNFQVPYGVTSISVVCVGAGKGGGRLNGGNGGSLRYVNNISVTPLETLAVTVGIGGASNTGGSSGTNGGSSALQRSATYLCFARGGGVTTGQANIGTGGDGGSGGGGSTIATAYGDVTSGGGGAGAGGYSGNGGRGGDSSQTPTAGAGGGGGGGGYDTSGAVYDSVDDTYRGSDAAGGGGVGLLGSGSNGSSGNNSASPSGGNGGSGGTAGAAGGGGGLYGGGGGGGYTVIDVNAVVAGVSPGAGAYGAVRIIWPGDVRQFPSTRTADE